MAWGDGCGCGNWWNQPLGPCSEFTEPTVPDEGRCSSTHVQISCEAPTLPVAQCADEAYTVIYQPENEDFPFAISATLFDECCQAITNEAGEPITLILTEMSAAASGTCVA